MPRQYTPGPLPFVPFLSVELTCQQCNARFLVPRARATQRFCSAACWGEVRRSLRPAVTCAACGLSFTIPPSEARRGVRKACSPACAAALKVAQRTGVLAAHPLRVTLACQTCGDPFSVKASKASKIRFCSAACRKLGLERQVKGTCATCGAPFSIPASEAARGRRKSCSRACAFALKRTQQEPRFWAQVDKNGPVPEHRPELGPCWLWTGRVDANGYGKAHPLLAHRMAWTLLVGPIPDALCMLHHCDAPPCVRPEHLFLGTRADNVADKVSKNRQLKGSRVAGAKLDDQRVRNARRDAALGIPIALLADEHGVSRSVMQKAVDRVTWKHVD